MRVVARRMTAATEGATQAAMAFRADAAVEGGHAAAAGDPKALLRQISGAAAGDVVSPRRLLASVVSRTSAMLEGGV